MARPKKDGLLYFSFDVDFFSDKKIKALKVRYKNDGLILYIYLLTEIYRNGYYIRWDEDYEDNAMDDLGLAEGFIKQVMTFLTNRSLLMSITVGTDTILTSPGIQKRYQEAAKSLKRDIFVNEEIWLLNKEETATCIKFAINASKSEKNPSLSKKNPSKSEKNSTNESKVNEMKVNENKVNIVCAEPDKPPSTPPIITFTLNDKSEHPVYQSEIDVWKELYPAVDILQELRKMKGWLNSNPTKRKTKRGINRFVNSWLAREQDNGGSKSINKGVDLEAWADE